MKNYVEPVLVVVNLSQIDVMVASSELSSYDDQGNWNWGNSVGGAGL